jgi:hypothetical protein
MGSPQQATHLPQCGIFARPGIATQVQGIMVLRFFQRHRSKATCPRLKERYDGYQTHSFEKE